MVNMIVAVYNPSTDPTNYTSIAVPHGHYNVTILKGVGFAKADASVLCDNETIEGVNSNNCWMYVDY
jgi:hypothetical protein